MIEKYLIEHCSPTLASLKTANLINIPTGCTKELFAAVEEFNQKLSQKGVELLILKTDGKSALIYTFRKSRLSADLKKTGVHDFLKLYGYEKNDADYCLSRLKKRLEEDTFPHEIGIFLGYPLGDVRGFIENAGQNSKCCGCWKVYCNECEAVKTFAKFEKCKKIYTQLWLQGRSIINLTVAA